MKAAAYCATRNLYEDTLPSLKSLLINTDVERVYLVIEDDEIGIELPECVECINVWAQPFYFDPDGPNFNKRWTYMALMRAALPFMFPDLDRILSLDPDVIIDKGIGSYFWDLPVEDYYLAGAIEPFKTIQEIPYVNMGVAVFNLKLLRESGKCARIIKNLNRIDYRFPDQDAINAECYRRILPFPSDYNASIATEEANDPKVIHYAAIQEWQHLPLVEKYRSILFSDIR